MKKVLFIVLAMSLILVSCDRLDVIKNHSLKSFTDISVSMPESVFFDPENSCWVVSAPDKSARFMLQQQERSIALVLEFAAEDFLGAGLSVDNLPREVTYHPQRHTLSIYENISAVDDLPTEAGILAVIESVINADRRRFGYHSFGDHYGIEIGAGNFFMWARDRESNQNTVAFMLSAGMFSESAVKLENIKGWRVATIDAHEGKKTVQAKRLVKSYKI